ncbi:MAG: hypothetical protein KAH86_03940, partial [Methanosarcinales archaeon]|nr:hypothetical protein [Methanosarcinales archaeon]
ASGNEQWSSTFGGADYDYAFSVQQTSDGGYIITGYTVSYGAGNADIWLIKTDENGNERWSSTFGGSADDYASSVQQTSDGGYIITGHTVSYGAGVSDAWLIKSDKNGTEQWNSTFGGVSNDATESVQQTSDGGYILAGRTSSYGVGNYDAWLIKTDASGDEQWNNTFGGAIYDVVESVQQTSDGGYILAGRTDSYGAGGADVWLIKVSRESDTTSPSVTITSPTDGTTSINNTITVSGTASDNIDIVNVTVNGILATGTTNWNASITLTEGVNIITVAATDSSGNINTTSINVMCDSISPSLYFVSPTTTGYSNLPQNYIETNVTVIESNLKNVTTYLYNSTYLVTSIANTTLPAYNLFTGLADGKYYINATAYDYAGNSNTTFTREILLDTIAPTITIDIPQELNNYSTSTVALNVSADESIVSWQYSINGSTNTPFSPNTTLPVLPDGNHNVTVYANDSAGNVGSTLVNFTIDTMPPTAPSNLMHTDDATSGYDNDHSIELTWDASSDTQSSITYRIYRNGVLNASTTSAAYTLAGETEGSHTYNVSAQDSTGNMNTTNASVTVIVDYTNPLIHNLSLSDTTPRYKQQIIVSVNISDANIANVTAGGTLLTHQFGALWNGTIIAEHGANTVTVIAYDGANNSITNSSLSYTGHASPKNNRGGGSNTGGIIGIISPDTQIDDDDDDSDNDDDGDIEPFVKDDKDDDGKSKTRINTPEDAKTTFKTNEPNANGFLEKLPGFGLILAIFGMLAMAGYIKRRA